MKTLEIQPESVPLIIAACCTLHNICEVHGEEFDSSWIDEVASHTCELPQPEHSSHSEFEGCTVETNASSVREILVEYFST